MTIYKSKEKGEWITQRSWYTNANGDRCENSGVRIRFIMPIIYQYVVQYKEKLLALSTDEEVKEQRLFLNNKRDSLLSEVEKRWSSITRIQSAFEDGAYNLSQYKERSKKVEKEISELEQEIQTTEVKIKNIDEGDVIEKRSKVARFLEMYDSEEESESKKNAILRSFVGSVVMTKHRKAIDLHINFL
jgi:septal ring factor EnvC (AmiA/AmiB activator)